MTYRDIEHFFLNGFLKKLLKHLPQQKVKESKSYLSIQDWLNSLRHYIFPILQRHTLRIPMAVPSIPAPLA